jgi:hypothetical protein
MKKDEVCATIDSSFFSLQGSLRVFTQLEQEQNV